METPFCNLLGIKVPIGQAPIGVAAVPALAAAVSNAGALGTLALTGRGTEGALNMIKKTRELTNEPFCVNFLLPYVGSWEEELEVALEEKVPAINLFWGDPKPLVDRIHGAGSILIMQVGSVKEALYAAECGTDVIIAQGWEAGGHVRGEVGTLSIVAEVVNTVSRVPVLAAGGISDGRGLAAALALGAAGVWIGTRFLASKEAHVPSEYIKRILRASADDTVHTTIFDRTWPAAPHRALRNSTYVEWERAGCPPHGERPGEGDILASDSSGYQVQRYEAYTPSIELKGDIEALALWSGQGVG